MEPLADQSIFVRGAISGVVREALIAACLTALTTLIFLGNWRSTLIIATSIPLAILTSLIVLSVIGETINIMTLGGLALAVGILVDDATVEVENINRNREAEPEKEMDEVVLDSAMQIATPAFVATLSICIVFAPMFLLSGVGTISFSTARRGCGVRHVGLLFPVADHRSDYGKVPVAAPKNRAAWSNQPQSAGSDAAAFRSRLRSISAGLSRSLRGLPASPQGSSCRLFRCVSGIVSRHNPWLGQDLFPTVDAGSFKLHLRGPTGMRIEDTAFLCDLVELRSASRSPGRDQEHHRQYRPACTVASTFPTATRRRQELRTRTCVTLSPNHHLIR